MTFLSSYCVASVEAARASCPSLSLIPVCQGTHRGLTVGDALTQTTRRAQGPCHRPDQMPALDGEESLQGQELGTLPPQGSSRSSKCLALLSSHHSPKPPPPA